MTPTTIHPTAKRSYTQVSEVQTPPSGKKPKHALRSDEERKTMIDGFAKALGPHLNSVDPHTGSKLNMFEHQFKSARRVSKALSEKGSARCILAHDMGTGKTVTAIVLIAFLSRLAEDTKTKCRGLVVVPVSMLDSWKRTLLAWLPIDESTDLIVGKSGERWPTTEALAAAKIVLVTKDCLTSWLRSFTEWNAEAEEKIGRNGQSYFVGAYKPKRGSTRHPAFSFASQMTFVIVDEVHMINPKTWDGEAVSRFTKHASTCIGLTGTPVTNNLTDVPRILRVLGERNPDLVDETMWQGSSVDRVLVKGLNSRLDVVGRDVIFPSLPTREDVVKEYDATVCMQPPTPDDFYAFSDKIKEERLKGPVVLYNEHLDSARAAARRIQQKQGGRNMTRLLGELAFLRASLWSIDWALAQKDRFLACPEAVAAAASQPTATLCALAAAVAEEQLAGHARVAVYNPSVTALKIAQMHLKADPSYGEVFLFDGSLSVTKRTKMISDFLACAKGVLLLSKAGGVGLTICPGCEVMIFCDYPWSPMDLEQAACRVWRIGQTKPVRCVHLVARGSIHSALREMYGDKKRLAKMVVHKDFSEGTQWKMKEGVVRMMNYADPSTGNLDC